ncbi:MAG: carboxypeptidase regulatory-like domain-containing protein, partial [Caldilineaceae bacterium]|nr:carboxypeptidase regulatory-like domain-containing protein [Caldilineaceae bacterium]
RPTEQGREEIATTTLDIDGQYVFADLAPGRYVVVIPAAHSQDEELAQEITLAPDASNVVLNFDLAAADGAMSHSTVVGTVRGGAGAVVMLLRASDGEEWVTLAQEDGCFKFVDLPPGLYSARVHPAGTRMENIALDGHNEQRIELAVSGWGHTVHYRTDDPRAMAGVVRCTVDGHKGVAIHLENRAGRSEAVQTGSSPEFGPYAAELTDIAPGDYLLVAHVPVDNVPVDDVPVDDMPVDADEDGVTDDTAPVRLEARIYVDRKQLPEVLFVQSAVHTSAEHRQSQVHGRLHAPQEMLARPLTVTLVDGQARRLTQPADPEGNFAFTELSAGAYFLEVVGFEAETRQTNIALDGANTVQIDLALSLPVEAAGQGSTGVIAGFAPAAAGKLARLVDDVGNEYTRLVNKHDRFYFDGLPHGAYTLTVEGGYVQPELQVAGEDGVEVLFSPVESVWSVDVNHAGAMPGFSILRVQVDGSHNLPVHIWQQDGDTITRRTGSNTEFGDDVAEFGPLEPGEYMVEADGVALQTQVELTGLEVLWVHFQRTLHPLTPHLVRPLAVEETRTLPPFDAALYRPESTPVEATTNVVSLSSGSASTTYVLIGEGQFGGRELQEIVAFATQHHAQVGRHIAEALQADVVAVVGQLAEGDLSSLRAADVAVKEWSWSTEPGPVRPGTGEVD